MAEDRSHSDDAEIRAGGGRPAAMSPAAFAVSLPIRAYRIFGSPLVGMHCRFQPTCSAYALEALAKHGAFDGLRLAAKRIARCHPWGGSGYDEVPDRRR